MLRDARHARPTHPYFSGFEIVVAAGAKAGPGCRGEAAGRGGDRARRPRRTGRLDHALVRQADDRRDGPRVGRDPDAALAEVARVLLPGGVPGAVALGVPRRRGRPRRAEAHLLRVRVRPEPGASPARRVRDPPRGRERRDPRAGDRQAAQLPADLRLHGRRDDPARRRRRARLGDRRHRRDRARAAVELAAPGRGERAHALGRARAPRPAGDARADRGLPRARQQRRAGRHLDEDAEEGEARAGRQARPGAEAGSRRRPPSSARRSARSCRSSSPGSRCSCT